MPLLSGVHLFGERCVLGSWSSASPEEITRQADNVSVWRNLLDFFPNPYRIHHANEWIALNQSEEFIGRSVNFCIFAKVNDDLEETLKHPAGGISLKAQGINQHHVFELGYWLGEEYWGRGLVSEAISLIVEFAWSERFTSLNQGVQVERLTAIPFAHNHASHRVLQKNGFALESVQKKAWLKDGQLIDGLVYVKFRPDSDSGSLAK
eukprot:TRINITY_DN11219_c0_g1_i2.p1 TRINITY_DN11219_c0_g1~~TRINITY_DN11219_c0_g1_i2.p1  ORF type:complete len:207 (+),score=20.81 TRINITY_DN11219_c0_g1_i2:171-791(+)